MPPGKGEHRGESRERNQGADAGSLRGWQAGVVRTPLRGGTAGVVYGPTLTSKAEETTELGNAGRSVS
jgi:hypothetical protein